VLTAESISINRVITPLTIFLDVVKYIIQGKVSELHSAEPQGSAECKQGFGKDIRLQSK